MNHDADHDCFRWLSAPGPSALGLLALRLRPDGNSPLHQQLTPAAKPRRIWLRDDGPLDEVLYTREGDAALVTCHGGAATRQSLEQFLTACGFRPDATLQPWGRPSPLLEALARVRGRLGAELVLEALAAGELPEFAGPLPDVRFLFEPPRVQLWGPVNAGKSSLLNALCGQELAAVAEEPGLTRDVIEGRFEYRGLEISVFDAPGEFPGARGPDADALALAEHWRSRADLVLRLVPPGTQAEPGPGEWIVHSRCDEAPPPQGMAVSVKRPETLEHLKQRLYHHFTSGLKRGPALYAALANQPPS
jgi:hypothetical protein